MLGGTEFVARSPDTAPWEPGTAGYDRAMRVGRELGTEGRATLDIAALGIALGYVIVVAAGAVGALWVLVRLFGEAPGEATGAGGGGTIEGWRGAECFGAVSGPSAPVGLEPSRDEAA